MRDKSKLRDILDAIEAIEAYSVASYDEFLADPKTQDAILYNLIINKPAHTLKLQRLWQASGVLF
jgi:uncharacterized protein with HEPN domain